VFGPDDDCSPVPEKTLLLVRPEEGKSFENTVELLKRCADLGDRRFLAFGDSRKAVERIVAGCLRDPEGGYVDPADSRDEIARPDLEEEPDLVPIEELLAREDEESDGGEELPGAEMGSSWILPYRAGYEADDRAAIQQSLTRGDLVGVVSTSALELGLDIGEIDLVVLLSAPPSAKAFWQRIGRTGRIRAGVCILIDSTNSIPPSDEGLRNYLERPLEPNWLYLSNRYIQYTNAMCAAVELAQLGRTYVPSELSSLPDQFVRFLANELNPSELVPPDLYPLKQRGQDDPHHEFPLRGGVEQTFKIIDRGRSLGEVTLAQALREAYPGAVYYYMARPFRIRAFNFHEGIIIARPERFYTTTPNAQTKVFPRFQGGMLNYYRSPDGFVVEAEMQVSERVLGFTELRGSVRSSHQYGPGSPYSQRPLTRFFETTGVCWYFSLPGIMSEEIATRLLSVFCERFAIQERDLGIGAFFARRGPADEPNIAGYCIYDATQGSLRLTQLLATHFHDVATAAATHPATHDAVDSTWNTYLQMLASAAEELAPQRLPDMPLAGESASDDEWVRVIANGEPAIFLTAESAREVVIRECRYTPRGLMYRLEHEDAAWWVPFNAVQAIHGETKMVQMNLMTGETKPLGESVADQ
jgi:DEAD/DEAH box helicase domain-containing protein